MGTMEHWFLRCFSLEKVRQLWVVDRDKEEWASKTRIKNQMGTESDTIFSNTTRIIRVNYILYVLSLINH